MYHTYYRVVFQLTSPLSVGNGGSSNSAHDCVRHKDGSPYIPAAAVAGAFRNFCIKNKDIPDDILNNNENIFRKSGVIFSNAELISESVSSVRETISLKEKSVVENTDFSMEVVETGAEFVSYIEIDKFNQDKQVYIEKLLNAVNDSLLRFGSKVSRGYGMVKIISLKKISFDLGNNLDKWLDFDMFSESVWDSTEEFVSDNRFSGFYSIRIAVKQKSSLSIRVFDTGTARENEKYVPDQKHITLRNGKAVITGTSWAGAFRERFRLFAGDERTEMLFGSENNSRSGITFSESVIDNCIFKNTTRNSIDRFSSKIKSGAIYIERNCSDGTAELLINVPDNISENDKKCLSAVIFDLNLGLLSVGGLASVGHGMFSIENISVNGTDKTYCLEKNDLYGLWR